jgi:hypothetical protein
MDCVTAQRIKLIHRVAAIATRIAAAQMPNRMGGPRHAVIDERGEARDPPYRDARISRILRNAFILVGTVAMSVTTPMCGL